MYSNPRSTKYNSHILVVCIAYIGVNQFVTHPPHASIIVNLMYGFKMMNNKCLTTMYGRDRLVMMGMRRYCGVVFSCETHELDWGRSGEEFLVLQFVLCTIYTRAHTDVCSIIVIYMYRWGHSKVYVIYHYNQL